MKDVSNEAEFSDSATLSDWAPITFVFREITVVTTSYYQMSQLALAGLGSQCRPRHQVLQTHQLKFPSISMYSPGVHPPLIARPRPNQVMSKRTCDPVFFDKHFSQNIKLLHVKRLPTLISDFVDKTIANGLQFPLNPYSTTDFSRVLDDIEMAVVDEKDVARFYERTTATFSLGLASSLALGVPSLLRWSQSANVSGYAIAEGFLYFPNPNGSADRYAQLEVGMGKETVKHIRLMAAKRSSLATYEFKNLAYGREEVMHAVPNLSNMPIFEWTDCKAPDCATLTMLLMVPAVIQMQKIANIHNFSLSSRDIQNGRVLRTG